MSRIREKAHVFLDHYEYMNSVFIKNFGYKLYFIGGTLLGFIREHDFLAHDKDMDVSYFSKYEDVKDVRKELIEIVHTLIDLGEKLYFIREEYTIVKHYFRWKVDERDRIDVMPTWFQDGLIYRPTFVGYPGGKDTILPLKEAQFYGHKVYIPNKPEVKLANVYGESWRVPDKGFIKEERKNKYTNKVIEKQLPYGKDTFSIIKKNGDLRDLSLKEKIFMFLIYLHNNSLLSVIPLRRTIRKKLAKKIKKSK